MRHYRKLVQRHLWWVGGDRRFLSKNPSFSGIVETLLEEFPDARIVANIRTPLQTVPSLLSGMEEGWTMFGNMPQPGAFRARMRSILRYYYAHLADVGARTEPSRWRFIDFQSLIQHPGDVVVETLEGLEYVYHADLRDICDRLGRRDGDGQRPHPYTLAQFDLTPESLRNEFEDAFERFPFLTDPCVRRAKESV